MFDIQAVISQDRLVDSGFDRSSCSWVSACGMGKIEAQPVGRHQRAGLAGVLAQGRRAARHAAGEWRYGCA